MLDAAAKRAEPESEGNPYISESFFLHIGCTILTNKLFSLGSNGERESVSDSTKKEGAIPDLCVICLEQEYNAVFVQ